jgi:hypothetical protein
VAASKSVQGVLLYDANGNVLVGQKTRAESLPVVVASDATGTNAANAQGAQAEGVSLTANPVVMAGRDEAGQVRVLGMRAENRAALVEVVDHPTFTVTATDVGIGNLKSMLSLYNASGSTRIVRLREVYLVNMQSSAVTGVIALFELRRLTAIHSAGTLLTPIANDTADTIDASVTARTGATFSTETAPLRRWRWSTDEWGTGTLDQEGLQQSFQTTFPALVRGDPESRPITLRANEGVHIKCATNSTAGTFDIVFVFTQETT